MRAPVVVLLVLILWGGAARAQDVQMTAQLPSGAPGEQVLLTGTVGSECVPGTAESGMSRRPVDEWSDRMGGGDDPRFGDEIVFLRPDAAPGESFSANVTLPDPQGAPMVFYAVCRQDIEFESWVGHIQSYRFADARGGPGQPRAAEPASARGPFGLVAAGAAAAAVAAAAALLVRSARRKRVSGHAACVVRHTAGQKGAVAARAAVQVATRSEAARADEALGDVGSAVRDARQGFDVLLDEDAVVEAAIDDVVRRTR